MIFLEAYDDIVADYGELMIIPLSEVICFTIEFTGVLGSMRSNKYSVVAKTKNLGELSIKTLNTKEEAYEYLRKMCKIKEEN